MASFFNFSSPAWARTTLRIRYIDIQGLRDIYSPQFFNECRVGLQRITPFSFLYYILDERWRAAKYESGLGIHKSGEVYRQPILFLLIV